MRVRMAAALSAALVIAGCSGAQPDQPAEPPPPPRTSAELAGALLVADDIAAVGPAEPASAPSESVLGACEAELGVEPPTARAAGSWEFADGRSVVHAVEAHPLPQDVVERMRGGETCLSGGLHPGLGPVLGAIDVDAQDSWCFRDDDEFRCGGVVAKGDLLLVVEAAAKDEPAAGALVAKLVPAALDGAARVGFRPAAEPERAPTSAVDRRSLPDIRPALLTAADLAELGEVTLVEAWDERYLSSCVDQPPSAATWVAWDLPDDGSLTQVVEAHADAAGKLVAVKGRLRCLLGDLTAEDGPPLGDLPVEQQHSWCVDVAPRTSCGALLAQDGLLVLVIALAESRTAAERTLTRVVQLAVEALDRA